MIEVKGKDLHNLPLNTYVRRWNGKPVGRIITPVEPDPTGDSRVVVLNSRGKRELFRFNSETPFFYE